MDRVQDRVLALLLLKFQIKIWDIIDFFVTGYDGKGARASTRQHAPHTFKFDTCVLFNIQNEHVLIIYLILFNKI